MVFPRLQRVRSLQQGMTLQEIKQLLEEEAKGREKAGA
jgi:DNA-binding transcriptional MerR regulator